MTASRKIVSTISVGAVAVALALTSPASASSANGADRVKVPRTSANWVARTPSLGQVPAKTSTRLRVYLAPRGGTDALKAAVAEIADPASSQYRKFLTARQYHARYDATSAEVSAVSAWLSSNQLAVTKVERHHRYVTARGTVSSVEQAFAVTIKKFRHKGAVVQANTQAASVPAAIAPYVLTVTGLDTTPHRVTPKKTHSAPPSPGFRNARPCSTSYGQIKASKQADYKTKLPKFKNKRLPYAVCGYTGPQLRSAYQGANATGLDGTGTTVAITDAYASPTIAADANRYATRHGDGSYAKHQLRQVVPKSFRHQDECGPSGWYGEETLDVEAVHAMAPGANIRYYASRSCYDNDFLKTLSKVVDQNKASLVSNSWSDLEANESASNVAAYEQVFLQGALQGIGFLFSSGDSGDELDATGLKQVDYPSSDPYVTAVGGTSDAIGADGSFTFQTGWGTEKYSLSPNGKRWEALGFIYGAGGGNSSLFNRPGYQQGVVPARYGSGRAVPDVALDADPTTGMLVGQTQTFPDGAYYGEYRIGGTSLASPLLAGMAALLQQGAGGRVGFLNPTLYSQAGSDALTDIEGNPADAGNVRVDYANGLDATDGLLYSVRTFNQDSSLALAEGWDDVTGLGSPNAAWITSLSSN